MTAAPFFPARARQRCSAGKGLTRRGTDEPDGPAGVAQAVHRLLGLGGERSDHHENQLCVVAAIGFDGRVLAAEFPTEFFGNPGVDPQGLQGRKVCFVAEIGIGPSAQDSHGAAFGGTGPETDVFGIVFSHESAGCSGIGNLDRLPGEGEVEAVHVDYDGKPHGLVLCQAKGHESAVKDFLAGGAVDLQETAVPRRQDVVVVGLEGDRRREPARNIDHDERHPPAGQRCRASPSRRAVPGSMWR